MTEKYPFFIRHSGPDFHRDKLQPESSKGDQNCKFVLSFEV
jgi:hypothetical protein